MRRGPSHPIKRISRSAQRASIVDRLHAELNGVIADPKVKERLADIGATVFASSSADFGKFIAADIEKWGRVIRLANIKPE